MANQQMMFLKEQMKLALDLVYQEVEDFGLVPNLKVNYILSPTLEKHEALDVLSTYKDYDALFVTPAIEAGNQLKRYSYSFINVDEIRYGEKTMVSRISPNFTKYTNYNDMIADFSRLITNIYYDFTGKVSIELGKEQQLTPAPLFSADNSFARSEIARAVQSILQEQVIEFTNSRENQTSVKR